MNAIQVFCGRHQLTTLANAKEDAYYKDVFAVINNGRVYYGDVILARRKGYRPPGRRTRNSKRGLHLSLS